MVRWRSQRVTPQQAVHRATTYLQAQLQHLALDLSRCTGTGFSGTGGGSAVLSTLGTGYLVTRFSYQPIFVLAGLMHPMSLALIYWLLPDRDFQKARRSQVLTA